MGHGFDDRSTVLFGGEVTGRPIWVTDTQIIVKTRAHEAGVVDVTVVSPTGDTVTLPNSFTFVDEDAPVTARPETPLPGITDPGGQQPIAPGNSEPPATGDLTGVEPTASTAPIPAIQASFGEITPWQGLSVAPILGPSNLIGAIVAGSNSQQCASSSCAGVTLSL